ncbi:hypothetical protein [Streptomyces alboflavus]|uniref:hypothetical protein n=1 Tax=Streptomyces alboflavus TaxID=67267 RepID=UPI000F658F25|nr:hypothetical protein [Streptomyces alboflavus]
MENRPVAQLMHPFFRKLPGGIKPHDAAIEYFKHLHKMSVNPPVFGKPELIKSQFHVGVSVDDSQFSDLTKKVSLVSDTLLLSHDRNAPLVRVGKLPDRMPVADPRDNPWCDHSGFVPEPGPGHSDDRSYWVHCRDVARVGQWILDAEPLLKKGLAWYLPHYTYVEKLKSGRTTESPKVIDYIITGRRVIHASGGDPTEVKSRVVRPILQIDLPFIEGVNLREFSKITSEEFDSYRGFRSFLRGRLLQMDEGLNADNAGVELAIIREEIEDQIRSVTFAMREMRRRNSWAAAGAVAGTTAAVLVAVNGKLFEVALAALGLSGAGSLWQYLGFRAESGFHPDSCGKWYYVWVLSDRSQTL